MTYPSPVLDYEPIYRCIWNLNDPHPKPMPRPEAINAGDPVTHDLWPDGERRIVQRVDDGSAYGHGWRMPIDELERVE